MRKPQRARWLRWLVDVLLRAYPREFRQEFGDELKNTYVDRFAALRQRKVGFPVARVIGLAVWHSLRDGLLERLVHNRQKGSARNRILSAPEALTQDLRYTLRSFKRKPTFFSVVLLLFALGIGANTVIYSVVDGVVLRPLPYVESRRLVTVSQTFSYPEYEDWLDMNSVFDAVGIYRVTRYTAIGGDQPELITGTAVTYGVFAALRAAPILGRTFLPEDDVVGGPRLVVLSHGLWQRRFGSYSTVLGRTMLLDEEPYVIIGVMPPRFQFPDDGEMWTTFSDERRQGARNWSFARAIARLKPGVSIEWAQRDMEMVAARLSDAIPPNSQYGMYTFRVVPYKEAVVGNVRPALLLLLGAVGSVLLISCVNIANLLLVRTSGRRRELAVRASIGAARWRLMRQLLTESLVLSLIGGALGVIVAIVSIEPFVTLLPSGTPRLGEISVDLRVLTVAAGVSVLTGALVGLLPSITAVRTPLVGLLQGSSRASTGGRHRNRTQSTLLVFEVALTVVLLVGAGLLTKSFMHLTSVDRGFDQGGVVTMRLNLRGARYSSMDQVEEAYRHLRTRLQAIPGVTTVAAATSGPFMVPWNSYVTVETRAGHLEARVHMNEVSSSYFQAMGIPLIAGRIFTSDELAAGAAVAVVSESMARTYWPNEQAVGRRFKVGLGENSPWLTVVGVAGDVRRRLETEPYPTVYRKLTLRERFILLETAIPPTSVMAAAREAVNSVDPDLPIIEMNTLGQRISRSVAGPRVRFLLVSSLAGVATALSMVGIFGVLAFAVEHRTNEIGIRMALGAAYGDVIRSVVNRGLALVGIGIAIGIAVSLVSVRALESFLFEVDPLDPATLLAVTVMLGLAAMAASYLPARRAAKVNPVEALRRE
jgi:putative ABC transport system permease protein